MFLEQILYHIVYYMCPHLSILLCLSPYTITSFKTILSAVRSELSPTSNPLPSCQRNKP